MYIYFFLNERGKIGRVDHFDVDDIDLGRLL